MHFFTTFFGAGLASVALAAYTVQDDYSGNNFFAMFGFDTFNDPTNGYVNFVDGNTAQQDNLTSVDNGVVMIRADSTNIASGRGRNAVRLTSYKQYTHGLVVLDLQHMPGSACGVWPAFWMTGPSWPNNGEIDIIEGVNYQTQNAMTMHTNGGCTMVNKNCQGEGGCGTETGGSASFSDGFNNAQGGVYAMEWTSSAINIWFFPRSSIPNGATGSNPDPSSWGNPTASFQGGPGCTIDDHFKNNNMVFDTTFCGDWAGSIWAQDTTCSAKAATCQDYVQNHPEAFESAYWSINSLKVYSDNGNAAPAQAAPVPSPSPKAAEPVAQPTATSTKPVVPATTPTATANEGNVGLGSSTPGGTVTENPTTGGPGKRELDGSPFSSVVEQPAVTRREGTEEVVVKRGGVGRHLRRHLKAGHAHHRHS